MLHVCILYEVHEAFDFALGVCPLSCAGVCPGSQHVLGLDVAVPCGERGVKNGARWLGPDALKLSYMCKYPFLLPKLGVARFFASRQS